MSELFITNFNPRLTGVATTIDNLYPAQAPRYNTALVGHPLPNAPAPITRREARSRSRSPAGGTAIWHVRRDPEMQAGMWARDVLRLPIKLVFTSAAQRRHSAWPRWLISRMDAVIATTQAAADALDHPVAAVVPHGTDTMRLSPAEDRTRAWQELGYGGTHGVATMGRIRPGKGTDIFVEAMIPILQADPGAVALITGEARKSDASFAEQLKSRAAQAGVADRMIFTGLIPNERIPALLRGASVIANLARREEFGVVPLEAMASGTPFVCSQTGAYPMLAQGGKTGLIAPIGDAAAASDMISSLLNDDNRRETMGRAGRAFVEAHHSITHEADAIDAVYQSIWRNA